MALEVRRDNAIRNRCRLATTAIILSMPGPMAAWWLSSWWFARVLPPLPLMMFLMTLPMRLWLAFVVVTFYVLVARPLASYRCPQCQRLLPRADDAALVPVPLRALRRGVGRAASRRGRWGVRGRRHPPVATFQVIPQA